MKLRSLLWMPLILTTGVPGQAEAGQEDRKAILAGFALPALNDLTGSRATSGNGSSASIVAGPSGGRGEFKLALETPNKMTVLGFALSAPLINGANRFVLGDQLPAGNKLGFEATQVLKAWTGFNAAASAAASRVDVAAAETRSQKQAAFNTLMHEIVESGGIAKTRVILLTGKYEFSRETFEFRPDIDAAAVKERKDLWSLAVQGGWMFGESGWKTPIYVGGGYRKSQSWKAATAKSLCSPTGSGSSLECVSVPIGAPSPTEKRSWSLELRHRVMSSIGWMPQLSYDKAAASGERWSLDIPVYLSKPPKDEPALNGGVVMGAKQGSGKYIAVFVGPAFSLPWSPPKPAEIVKAAAAAK